ncbi:ATP-dependent Clp protease proteolytic subunit [bioreactor metagenome]|uniref:ATP-dependent Clp protease proteolytic subunit n=1 Tax=bioreactor metagenome TaxID=1076179 RepID=A0A644WAM4_9ZZZZ
MFASKSIAMAKKNILLYKEIYGESAQEFSQDFMNAESECSDIGVRINSPGGSMTDGIAVYNTIKRSVCNTEAYIDGMAASMATVVMCACKRIHMSKHGMLMIHKPSAGNFGNADELRETADVVDRLEKTIVGIYADRCGKTPEEITALWMDGKDHWLTATEALSYGLIDDIYDNEIESAPTGLTDGAQFFNFYATKLASTKTKTDMKQMIMQVNVFLAMLKMNTLPETASESDVAAQFKALADRTTAAEKENGELKQKIANFEDKAKNERTAESKAIIDKAIADRKFTEKERPMYTALMENDFENTKGIIASMAVVPSAAHAQEGNQTEYDTLAKMSWDECDKANKLPLLKEKYADLYSAKFEEKFNRKPNNN